MSQKPYVVRVVRSDSSRLVLRNPTIQQDSLYGTLEASPGDTVPGRRGIPLADIRTIETRRSDPTKTALLGTGILVGTFTTLCLLADTFGCDDDAATILASAAR